MTIENEGDLNAELKIIAAELGGECHQFGTLNSTGRSSKKIVIEYDVQQTK